MSEENIKSLIQKTYENLSDEELIEQAIQETYQKQTLTEEAANILKLEVTKRHFDIERIHGLVSLPDEEYFEHMISNHQLLEINCGQYIKRESQRRLQNYYRSFEGDATINLLERLKNLKIAYAQAEYLALRIYLSNRMLTQQESSLLFSIIRQSEPRLASMDVMEEFRKMPTVAQTNTNTDPEASILYEIENAGKSLRNIGEYLVRYFVGSVGMVLAFFFVNYKFFGIIYFIYGVGSLIIFILTVQAFFSAGDSLINIRKKWRSNAQQRN